MSREKSYAFPERFTPEFLNKLVWKKTKYAGMELCEFGAIRRPANSKYNPGQLSYPLPNITNYHVYRIAKGPGTKERHQLEIEAFHIEVFGSLKNRSLLNYEYLKKLRVLCLEYNTRYFIKEETSYNVTKEIEQLGVMKKRKCTTCGRPTSNYRCNACWIAIRGQSYEEQPLDLTYSVSRMNRAAGGD